ncbi:class I SAM-dependent methyltransferase [Nocardioides sp. zg-1228]|uniref:class I SAM-dependent methyltransferase n=1 Tax=Nocardioides sp. zg-1228 TaxID=2763008 RepID=UPI00164265EC|nr:methyltransferase domain-containing protein [Nocardioides sp. zg-1228]MBC2934193.1 methyltransferase domain-containing protein [Nocardioides sp. zg-1228]QSF58938.1 methyltransferase domain-containing protein [Nocardioides sp. zg-1228]
MTFDVAGETYDRFMGRYSRPLAARLADWLEVSPGQQAVDVGSGPGALTGVLVERLGVERVRAIDPSEPFVAACGERFPGVDVRLGTAESLPFGDDTCDVAAACLVVHFMTDPVAGVAEMSRVTRPGGRVGATVWDLAGSRAPMWPLWEAVAELRPDHPGERGDLPGSSRESLVAILADAGLDDVESVEIDVSVTHSSFEEWWEPYLLGVGPAGEAVAALGPDGRRDLESVLRRRLGAGPFEITAVAHAARGRA